MSESDSLWYGEPDEKLKQSIRHIYAHAALMQFMERKITPEAFLTALQRLLCVPDPNRRLRIGKHLFNESDRELIGELIQLSTLPGPKGKKRGRGNSKSSIMLKQQAIYLASFLFNERPDALRKDVVKRVYELMAIDRGVFIQSQRTVEILLEQFFSARSKKKFRTNA